MKIVRSLLLRIINDLSFLAVAASGQCDGGHLRCGAMRCDTDGHLKQTIQQTLMEDEQNTTLGHPLYTTHTLFRAALITLNDSPATQCTTQRTEQPNTHNMRGRTRTNGQMEENREEERGVEGEREREGWRSNEYEQQSKQLVRRSDCSWRHSVHQCSSSAIRGSDTTGAAAHAAEAVTGAAVVVAAAATAAVASASPTRPLIALHLLAPLAASVVFMRTVRVGH